MPPTTPPRRCAGRPVIDVMPTGADLYRVFRHQSRGPLDFNSTAAGTSPAHGRFDSIDGSYAYLYVAATPYGALAEALLRTHRGPSRSERLLPVADLARYSLARLRLETPVTILSLQGADAGHVCQDIWLTTCDAPEYSMTREWAVTMRRWCPAAAGFRWRGRKDIDEISYVLFADRVAAAALTIVGPPYPLGSGTGLALATAVLERHNVTVS